jgi:LCP family protein required for cell wall assembly
LLAFVTLLGMGVEWNILDRAQTNIDARRVSAINTADTEISKPRTTEMVVTNSKGVKTTEPAHAATVYQPENILLLGSDTRAGGNSKIGGSDSSTSGVSNSDTLMVAHISGDRQHVTVLSIPRDTLVPAPKCKAWDSNTGVVSNQDFPVSDGQISHINSAYSMGGPKCTVTAIQALTHLEINRVIGIDFAGFQSMVDALGGVTVNICRPIIDQVLGTVVPAAGTQRIGGLQAVSLVRARDVIGDTESDLARIKRQQGVLSAILRQVSGAGTLLNPTKLNNFLQAFTKNTFTDNVKLADLVNLAGSMGNLDPGHVTFYTLPTYPSTRIDGALEVDETKAAPVFDDLVNDQPLPGEVTSAATKPRTTNAPKTTPAPSLKVTVDPAKVNLEIYNVTGEGNVAGKAQTALNAIGFKVTDDQLFKPEDQTQTGTTVQYDPANRAQALTVAAAVPGSTLVVTPGLGSTVRLFLGSSYKGDVARVKVGQSAPASLATAISTGPSVSTTTQNSSGASTAASTAIPSLNAGTAGCI